MLSFITSLWESSSNSSTTLTHACKEHITEKTKELNMLESEIQKEKNVLSEKVRTMTQSYKLHEDAKYETKVWLDDTLRSLKSVAEAINECVRSSDVEAIEQTMLLMRSVSVDEFRDTAERLREKEEAAEKVMGGHREEREKQRNVVLQLEESRANLIAHIEEIEYIQQQLERTTSVAAVSKRHSD
jgi:hypothetical protein